MSPFHSCIHPVIPHPRPPAWALPPEKGADLCPDWGISWPFITRDPVHSHISRRGSHWRVCGWAVCRGVGYVQGGGNGEGCLNEWENSKDSRSDPGQSDLQAIPPLPPRSRDKADVILSLSSSSLLEEMLMLLGFSTWEFFSLSECDYTWNFLPTMKQKSWNSMGMEARQDFPCHWFLTTVLRSVSHTPSALSLRIGLLSSHSSSGLQSGWDQLLCRAVGKGCA